ADARNARPPAAADRRRSDADPRLHGDDPPAPDPGAAPGVFVTVHAAVSARPARWHLPRVPGTHQGAADHGPARRSVRRDLDSSETCARLAAASRRRMGRRPTPRAAAKQIARIFGTKFVANPCKQRHYDDATGRAFRVPLGGSMTPTPRNLM